MFGTVLAVAGYSNYDAFAYSEKATVADPGRDGLQESFGHILHCTEKRREFDFDTQEDYYSDYYYYDDYNNFVIFPPFTSQVLRFRCGVFETLRDPAGFSPLRVAPHTVTSLLASSYWGVRAWRFFVHQAAITSVLIGCFFASIARS